MRTCQRVGVAACTLALWHVGTLAPRHSGSLAPWHAPTLRAQPHRHPVPSIPDSILERPISISSGIGLAHDATSTASKEAQAFYNQGLAYLHSYRWIDAARSFHEARRRDPQFALAHAGLGVAYGELVKPDPARAAFERARRSAERASAHDRRHIEISLLRRELEDAPGNRAKLAAYRAALDEALAAFPADVELWLARGMAESSDPADRGQGSTAASIPYYERALGIAPEHFAARHYLAHAYENTGRVTEALEQAEAYARLAPAIPHAHHMLGHSLRRVGRTEEAVAAFRRAYELETEAARAADVPPEHDWHHAHNLDLLAAAHQALGQMRAAEALLRRSFELPTMLVLQAFNKHEWPAFLLARGRRDEALAAARTLADHPAGLVSAIGHIMAGHALLAGAGEKGAKLAETAGAINTALTLLRAAGPEAALARPHFEAVQAQYFLHAGARDKGRVLAQEAVRKFRALPGPDGWSQALFRLEAMARAAREAGDWELAERVALALRDHDPSYAGTHYALGLVAEHNGDQAGARDAFAAAADAWRHADRDLPELLDVKKRLRPFPTPSRSDRVPPGDPRHPLPRRPDLGREHPQVPWRHGRVVRRAAGRLQLDSPEWYP